MAKIQIDKNDIEILAKQNSPLLLKMAKSYDPLFFSNLYELQPKLWPSELTFCIYLKLNFTTREIAKFLNVSQSAIENRRNRLRKKLNIPSDADLFEWLNNIQTHELK